MTFIEIAPNKTYLNIEHIVKLTVTKHPGKASVPDSFAVTALMITGNTQYIMAFESDSEARIWIAKTFDTLHSGPVFTETPPGPVDSDTCVEKTSNPAEMSNNDILNGILEAGKQKATKPPKQAHNSGKSTER